MNEQEEFEFRLRFERENAITGSAPSSQAGVEAAFGKPITEPKSILERLGSAGLSGSLKGGPIPAIGAMAMEGADIGNEALTKGAYEAGGKVTDITGRPEAGFATNIGIQAIPSLIGMGSKTPSLLEGAARRVMQSAVKPDKVFRDTGKAEQAIGSMLEKDINATKGSLDAQKELASKLETKVQSVLDQSKAMVDPENVAVKTLKESLKKITYGTDPKADALIIDKAVNTFLEHPQVEGLQNITVATANKLKQGIYAELKGNKYGQGLGKQPTEVMTDKVRAATLREEIAKAEPKVVPTLQEQSEVLNVIKVLGPQVSREGNKNLIGLGALSPRLENVAVWMLDRYPWFKSFLARGIYTGGKHPVAAGMTGLTATQEKE